MNKNRILAARLSLGFLVLLLVIISVVYGVSIYTFYTFLGGWILAGIVAFFISARSARFQGWDIGRKVGHTIVILYGLVGLLILALNYGDVNLV